MHHNYPLAFSRSRPQDQTMRHLLAAFFLTVTATLPLTCVSADQNPTPTNVGLYNYSTFTVTTSTSTPILGRNSARALLYVQNNGAVSVVIKPGSAPANATDGIVLTAGSTWEPTPPLVDALYGISASSTAKVIMIEGVK